MSICAAVGCDQPRYCRGFCTKHYQRFRKTGSPYVGGRPTLLERLPSLVDVTPFGCWSWNGTLDPNGYGRGSYRAYRTSLAHRIVFMELTGTREEDLLELQLDHLCRNTSCVNPDHLDPVTGSVNVRRGRAAEVLITRAAAITSCPQGHDYTPGNTGIDRVGARYCRTCRRATTQAWRARKRAERSGVSI